MKNKDLKISLIFALIGLIAGIFLGFSQIGFLTEELKKQVIEQFGSVNALIVVTAVQTMIITFITAFLGLKIARKVNLKLNFKFDKKSFMLAAVIAVVMGLIIGLSDKFIFIKYMTVESNAAYEISSMRLATSVLFGGVCEEVNMRLFLMSLLVLILWKVFARTKTSDKIPKWIYVSSIVMAALIFAALHLPATLSGVGTSTPIIVRCFVSNGVAGLGYGYLYWKKGLAYSISSHVMTHVFTQLILFPIIG